MNEPTRSIAEAAQERYGAPLIDPHAELPTQTGEFPSLQLEREPHHLAEGPDAPIPTLPSAPAAAAS
jgi:hypothetical protein